MIHMHHIIPKHMGGSNHPSNIVELTVQEHADAHNLLYSMYKNPYDRIAEQTLLGYIDMDEAKRLAMQANRESPHSEETKAKIKAKRQLQKMPTHSAETRKRISESMKKARAEKEWPAYKHSDEMKKHISAATKRGLAHGS